MSEDHYARSIIYASRLSDRDLVKKGLYVNCVNYIESCIVEQSLLYKSNVEIRMYETILKFLSIAEMDEMMEMLANQGYSAYREMNSPATLHISW